MKLREKKYICIDLFLVFHKFQGDLRFLNKIPGYFQGFKELWEPCTNGPFKKAEGGQVGHLYPPLPLQLKFIRINLPNNLYIKLLLERVQVNMVEVGGGLKNGTFASDISEDVKCMMYK